MAPELKVKKLNALNAKIKKLLATPAETQEQEFIRLKKLVALTKKRTNYYPTSSREAYFMGKASW